MARPKKDGKKFVRQNISMDPEQLARLTAFCQRHDRAISWVIRQAAPLDEVIEWKYMSQLQPETCKYTGGSYCWPIDQCSDCPNNPERSNGE